MNPVKMKISTIRVIWLLILMNLATGTDIIAQTPFWTETFDDTQCGVAGGCPAAGYVSANGIWTVAPLAGNTGTDPNVFYVSCTEAGGLPGTCGATCGGAPPPPPGGYTGQTLHLGSTLLGDIGAAFFNGSGAPGFFDASTEIRAESPLINTAGLNNISISFGYIENGDGATDDAQLWLFDQGTGIWTLIDPLAKSLCCDVAGNTVPCAGGQQGKWAAFTAVLPVWANNNAAGIKIGFTWVNNNDALGDDPSFAVDNIVLSHSGVSSNTLSISNFPAGPYCAGQQYTFSFLNTGTFNVGNQYNIIMSDAAGNFAPGTPVGNLASTALNGNITVTIPALTPAGAGYLFRLVSTNPGGTSVDVGPVQITAAAPASVTIAASPGTTICAGDSVLFVATPVNGGTTPTFQWQVNGVNQPGATNDSLWTTTLTNGNTVTVVMTSNAACVSGSPATSNAITITISTGPALGVTISVSPTGSVCSGDTLDFSSVLTNGGPTPGYQWLVNGVPVAGATGSTFSPFNLSDGDLVSLVASSSLSCSSNSPDTSAAIAVNIISGAPPQVQISSSAGLSICSGDTIIFQSVVLNGGSTPGYQWLLNGNPIPGATLDSLELFNANNGDLVSLELTSSVPCATPQTVTSQVLTVEVLPFDTLVSSLVPVTGICTKQIVTFSGVLGSNVPPIGSSYIWYLNGDSVAFGLFYQVPGDSLQDGDTLQFRLIANGGCYVDPDVTSGAFIIDVKEGSVIDAGTNREILYADTAVLFPFIISGDPNGSWIWTPDSTLNLRNIRNPIALPLEDTWYKAVFTNSLGCKSTDSVFIDVKPNYEVFVPSAFSPNNDGRNDVLYVRGPFISTCMLTIYNRWGQKIFDSPYLVYGWDGKSNYGECDSGVYTWVVEGTFIDGTSFSKKGNVTIFR